MTRLRVGVLALQGGYERHGDCVERLGVRVCPVRYASDLDKCAALIVPGGESTCLSRLIEARGLADELTAFARTHPMLGTCAGLILMARCDDPRVISLRVLDARVERNAYGRQTHSFQAAVPATLGGAARDVSGMFIRAPHIVACGSRVEILARYADRPVLIAQGPHMGASFHPELTNDLQVHAAWLQRAGLMPVASTGGRACA